jgi:hypothetical protein
MASNSERFAFLAAGVQNHYKKPPLQGMQKRLLSVYGIDF